MSVPTAGTRQTSNAPTAAGAVGRTLGARGQHLAAADLGARAQPEPRTEVLDGFEAAQVGTKLGQDLHHRGHTQPVDAREVHPGPVGQHLAGIEFLACLAARAGSLAQINVALSESA